MLVYEDSTGQPRVAFEEDEADELDTLLTTATEEILGLCNDIGVDVALGQIAALREVTAVVPDPADLEGDYVLALPPAVYSAILMAEDAREAFEADGACSEDGTVLLESAVYLAVDWREGDGVSDEEAIPLDEDFLYPDQQHGQGKWLGVLGVLTAGAGALTYASRRKG